MTVWFLSRRTDHQIQSSLIKRVNPSEINLLDLLQSNNTTCSTTRTTSWVTRDEIEHPGWLVLGGDIENRSDIQPNREGLLLSSFCLDDTLGNEVVVTIDNTSVDNLEVFTTEILKRVLLIAHNADHEARWFAASGFNPMRYACTMVNSKRLLSGQEGLRFDLISEINRRLGYEYIPIWMDKDIRSEFADCSFFIDDHILYNASDTIRLKAIYYKQKEEARRLGMSYLLNTLNSRIIPEIASTEIRGIKHDTEKWLGIAKERKDKADILCQELTKQLIEEYKIDLELVNPSLRKERESLEKRNSKLELRRSKLLSQIERLEQQNKTHLKSYTTQKDQLSKITCTVGAQETASQVSAHELINWGSQPQVLKAFEAIGMPIPMGKDQKTRQMKASVKKEARQLWLVANENSPYLPFFNRYDKYKKLIHNVTSFGEKWVQQYVRDGRVYTSFDQAGTDTGRWTSGSKGGRKIYPNMSQIPKPPEYRECFVADDGRVIITGDYRNQEGVIIISLSKDMEMKKITEVEDQHSHLGTKAWRAVYQHRYDRTKDPKWLELANTYEMNQSTPDKKKERDKFKNSAGLFPVLYGCFASKVAATAQVTTDEGQVMIDVIKSHAPQAWIYLNSKSDEGYTKGYVSHNPRSGSRRWFQKVLDNQHYGFNLTKSDKIEIESAARNSPIQGTGSDIMKEAIAMIALYKNLYKQDIQFMLSNYDEGVWSVKESEVDKLLPIIVEFMKRAAKNYLIPEVEMDVEVKVGRTWLK